MLIEIQEKKMEIEIFGENPIDSNLIRNQIKLSQVKAQKQSNKMFDGVEIDGVSADHYKDTDKKNEQIYLKKNIDLNL